MNAEKAIYARLAAVAGVTALVGTRIYPVLAPQNPTFPHLVYQRISAERIGNLGADTDMVESRVQVSCFADSYSGTKELADAVRLALQRADGTFGGVTVDDMWIESDQDIYDPQTRDHFVAIDVLVRHRE